MGFACDIGTMRSSLAEQWPHHRFDHLDARWWHHEDEPEALLHARCEAFRDRMATLPDWPRVPAVTHWGVNRAPTRPAVPNGAHLRCGPTGQTNRSEGTPPA